MSRASRLAVIACAREMAARGLVVGTVGNVSVRQQDRVIVTPTRLPYERMRPTDLVALRLDGRREAGRHEPSRELPLHLAVYRRRPDLGALVHTHSPHASAWSFLGLPLTPETEENRYYGIGPVLTSPPVPSGTDELAETAAAALGDSSAVLLGRHGVLAGGPDLDTALAVATVVEHQAQVALLLRGAGAVDAGLDAELDADLFLPLAEESHRCHH